MADDATIQDWIWLVKLFLSGLALSMGVLAMWCLVIKLVFGL